MEIPILERRSKAEEAYYNEQLFVILSHPRSGSHWVRRMLAEVIALRGGETAEYGDPLSAVAGFIPRCINTPRYTTELPLFYASHRPYRHDPKSVRVFLRRNFEDVYRSCRKAEKDCKELWFTGSREKVYRQWKNMTKFGCIHADLVVDYDIVKANPETAIRAIFNLTTVDPTDEEIACAVAAGQRKNMLNEQSKLKNQRWEIINELDYSTT